MKRRVCKIVLSFVFCFAFMLNVYAENFPELKYKNIKKNEKITYDSENDIWSKKINKKSGNYYIKTKGFGDFYDYVDSNKNFAFTTGCEYEFIYNDSLIGYSNRDMKFYEIRYINGGISKRAIPKDEVQKIFPDYKVIDFSDFSAKTNSLKIKKGFGDLKIILLNNSDNTFDNYTFTSGNAQFEQYDLRGFLTVSKNGMIQFSKNEEYEDKLWYVLLIR